MQLTKNRFLIRIQILTGIGLLIFWGLFFTIGLAPENPPKGFFEYEHSFLVPDLILALGLLYSAFLNKKDHAFGRDLTLVCGGAIIFLGVLDISFNSQNGMYALSTADLIGNLLINIWYLFVGGYSVLSSSGILNKES